MHPEVVGPEARGSLTQFPEPLKRQPKVSVLFLPVLLSFFKSGPLSGPHTGCSWSPRSIQLRVKKANCGPLFVFLAQHICVFFQWLSLACDFTCLFCKVPWAWVSGSLSTPDQHRLRGQSLNCGPFCRRWVLASFVRLPNSLWCTTICRILD